MSTLFKRIDTVFLQVNDFDRTIKWYCDVLGFTLRWKDDEGGYAALNIGETALTLVRSKTEPAKNANISFNFYTADIERAQQLLLQNNVNVGSINEDGQVKWFKFQDIEGNELEVCYFKE